MLSTHLKQFAKTVEQATQEYMTIAWINAYPAYISRIQTFDAEFIKYLHDVNAFYESLPDDIKADYPSEGEIRLWYYHQAIKQQNK